LEKAYNFLISNKIADKHKINEAYKESRESGLDIFNVLFNKRIISEEEAIKAKAKFLNIPYIDLQNVLISNATLKNVPEKTALFYKFVPFEKINNVIKIAIVDPDNIDALDALKFIFVRNNVNVKIYITSKSSFDKAVKQYRTLNEELENVLKNVNKQVEQKEKFPKREKEVERVRQEAPVSKIVDIIITHAVEGRASDIHIEPAEDELRVRYRLDGVLHDSLVLPKKISKAVVSRIKILANLKIDETRKPQDGRFRFTISNTGGFEKSIDLRVSTFPIVAGEKVVMRILDVSSDISSLESLGMGERDLRIVNENIKKPFGIVLITGPTGSGKSTTLYAIFKILNKEGVNIVTLEDPVEYFIKGINQSQIKPEIGYTFASGLRAILRQDPDIIMVGEIRDKETAELATHAALTGHLVLSTLHTNDAIGVIPRLIDMGIEPFLIASSLNVAIAQRLVRRICIYCRKRAEISSEIEDIVKKELKEIPENQKKNLDLKDGIKLFEGGGCSRCKKTGFSGRIGIYEVLSMTKNLKLLMSSKISDNDIANEAKRQGMITIMQDGIMKSLKGITTIEEVLRVAKGDY